MIENQDILKRRKRSSSLAFKTVFEKSTEMSRQSTAACSSKKDSTPKSSYKKNIFTETSNSRIRTDDTLQYLKSLSIANSCKQKRRRSITPMQLFSDKCTCQSNYSTLKTKKETTIDKIKQEQNNNLVKKPIKNTHSAVKNKTQVKNYTENKQQQNKSDELKEKKTLKKKIIKLKTQIEEENLKQKESDMYFQTNISTIKAKIGLIQQKRCQSLQKSQNTHENARISLEQKTKEFYQIQSNLQQIYSNMVNKHHQDQVDWSQVYTNLLKEKSNLKKNVQICQKIQ